MIEITTDPARKLICVVMHGMLTVPDVEAFGRAKEDAVRAMGLASGDYLLLVHARGNLVQTQEVMEALSGLIVGATVKARRIATVRDGVLTRMQARRMSKLRDDYEVFDDIAEAEAWLFDGQSHVQSM